MTQRYIVFIPGQDPFSTDWMSYEMFPEELVTNSIPGMIEMIERSRSDYDSNKYRKWVKDTCDPSIILPQVQRVIDNA